MFENSSFKKCVITVVFFYCSFIYGHNISAHEGHSHEAVITIGKKTVVHFQSILSTYREVYHRLVKRDLNGITDLAQKLSDAARQATRTEPDGGGRHMMKHVLSGAEDMRKARDIQDAQKAFASLSEALLPFFKLWPNQLKRNELKICQCRHDGHCWLQPQNCSDACPYSADQTKVCTEIEEVK
ncbi:MAG: DUF3347 domain-containing protein [Candidatus Brocadia sp.]|nr:DUF3347 domain-containing protein [Candidatus Brocadia sp.]